MIIPGFGPDQFAPMALQRRKFHAGIGPRQPGFATGAL